MDALELLRRDHARAQLVMTELGRTEGAEDRAELFTRLELGLDAHEAIEEEIFYPALQGHPRVAALVREGIEEHQVVDTLMSELDALPFDHETWGARCRVLIENIQHHMAQEEHEMFSQARKVFGRRELAALGEQMARRRREGLDLGWPAVPAGR